MKTLPVLREKKRYMAFKVMSEQAITRYALAEEISNSLHSLFGDKGTGEINAGLLSYDGRYGIIRCARDKTAYARAALACVTRVHGARVSILVLGISGTIRGATEKFIQQCIIKESEPENQNTGIQVIGRRENNHTVKNEIDISPDNPLSVKKKSFENEM